MAACSDDELVKMAYESFGQLGVSLPEISQMVEDAHRTVDDAVLAEDEIDVSE